MMTPRIAALAMDANLTGKRLRKEEEAVTESNTTSPDHERIKRIRHAPISDTAQYIVIHRVECGKSQRFHERHKQSADYLDVPRLVTGNSRATGLQGQQPIGNIDNFLEERDAISFAVYITYSCDRYHEEIEDQFQRQPTPQMPEDVAFLAKPYFFTLAWDAKPATRESEAMIFSHGLREALNELQIHEPESLDNWDTTHNLSYPYLQLYHCREIFTGPSASLLSRASQLHLQALYRHFDQCLSDEYLEAESLFKKGRVNRKHWPKLFRPNEVVVKVENGQPLAYVVTSCPLPSGGNRDHLDLDCWSWEFDGKFWRKETHLDIEWPSSANEVSINELQAYPLRYDKAGLKDELEKRGTEFWACRKRKFVSYDVPLQGMELQMANLRYMVDVETYKLMHSDEEVPPPRTELDEEAMQNDIPPAEPFVLLLPASIRGFGFHDKKWKMLLVKHIRDINWNKEVFEYRLVLEERKKKLIRALVTVHLTKGDAAKTDFLDGKGEGLIMLLHGGPGTGKTLTAESVAELAERPLYRVTCGDIGTDAESVENYLNSVLFIGSKWGCVVLLDEADVFLEERTKMDLQRNALVSVFLRVLEYYDGILILTTNRIGTFDEAFKSRIQLALHYPILKESGRKSIWRNFAKSLSERKEIEYSKIEQHLDELAAHKLNGRQIRNVVNTARQLASYYEKGLEYEHIDDALRVVNEFEEYVSKVHPYTEEEYAKEMGWRDG